MDEQLLSLSASEQLALWELSDTERLVQAILEVQSSYCCPMANNRRQRKVNCIRCNRQRNTVRDFHWAACRSRDASWHDLYDDFWREWWTEEPLLLYPSLELTPEIHKPLVLDSCPCHNCGDPLVRNTYGRWRHVDGNEWCYNMTRFVPDGSGDPDPRHYISEHYRTASAGYLAVSEPTTAQRKALARLTKRARYAALPCQTGKCVRSRSKWCRECRALTSFKRAALGDRY